jgi:putative membrane protein
MRVLLQVLIALVFVAGGVLFGAFNPQAVIVDFYVAQAPVSLGVGLLIALFVGAAVGGMAITVGIVWPMQRRLRRAERAIAIVGDTRAAAQSSQSTYPA